MKVISLDQSTTGTGLAIFTNGKLKNYFLIKPKSSKKVIKTEIVKSPHLYEIKMTEDDYGVSLLRITEIVDLLEKIFKVEKPNVVYFEEIYENNNPKGYRTSARLQGFIAHLAHQYGIRYVIVEENKWANSIATYSYKIKRDERKKDINKRINDLYGLNIDNNDITDALAIGTYALMAEKENKNG